MTIEEIVLTSILHDGYVDEKSSVATCVRVRVRVRSLESIVQECAVRLANLLPPTTQPRHNRKHT